MNVGGEPERDDFGLPPADIEIPDDARELDRDVQAYHRELRAQRRRMRARRLRGPLTRDGMVLPLLAGCLVLALISGTLLTLFTAGQAGLPRLPGRTSRGPAAAGPAAAAPPATGNTKIAAPSAGQLPAGRSAPRTPAGNVPAASSAAGQVGGPLPDRSVVVAGKLRQLRSLPPAVLALIPAGCQCTAALRQLVAQASQAHIALYFVGTGHGAGQLGQLAARTGQRSAQLAEDVDNVLGRTYQQSGLTALLVHANGSVAGVVSSLQPGLQLTQQFRQLMPVPQPTS